MVVWQLLTIDHVAVCTFPCLPLTAICSKPLILSPSFSCAKLDCTQKQIDAVVRGYVAISDILLNLDEHKWNFASRYNGCAKSFGIRFSLHEQECSNCSSCVFVLSELQLMPNIDVILPPFHCYLLICTVCIATLSGEAKRPLWC